MKFFATFELNLQDVLIPPDGEEEYLETLRSFLDETDTVLIEFDTETKTARVVRLEE